MTDLSEARLADWLDGLAPRGADQRPFPRWRLDRKGWRALLDALPTAPWSLAGLWWDGGDVLSFWRCEPSGAYATIALNCPGRSYPALSPVRPAAARLERALVDLGGPGAEGALDDRPWLDLGFWPHSRLEAKQKYEFLPVDAQDYHQIPVGPVHAGIIEPGHFRFTAHGETVIRLEERLGWVHKGTLGLMVGKTPLAAAKLAGRLSGDSTVAAALAFARAVEAASGTEPPPRAVWLRALFAELERLANHLGDIGFICNDAAFAMVHMECAALRELVARCADAICGHRLMMDRIIPGGVAADVSAGQMDLIDDLIDAITPRLKRVMHIYDHKSSLLDRTMGTGRVAAALVRRFAAGGPVGRASGRGVDVRKSPGYPPYDQLRFAVPVRAEGDVDARLRVRAEEAVASLDLLGTLAGDLPGGPVRVELGAGVGSGLAVAEAFRGDLLAWVRLDEAGRVANACLRDASWFQWPLLEAAIEGNIVADFPLCNKSFNCSYSGADI